MLHYVKDDITQSNCDIICHQVNCQGKMNSGVAKAIRKKWPVVYETYKIWCNKSIGITSNLLGMYQAIQVNDNPKQYVVNLFSQQYYGYDGTRFTNYEAFYNAINNLNNSLINMPDKTIAFPYKIGCVRGGANWNIIRTMIEEVFQDREIYFYNLTEFN